MTYAGKPLADMTPDELAQLSPELFKELADSHNDELELRENAYDRVIADSKDPASYPEMIQDAGDGKWRPMTDNELRREISRSEDIAVDLGDQISNADSQRLSALQSEEARRQQDERCNLPPLEPVPLHDAEIDALLEKLLEKEKSPEPVGKSLIPAVLQAIKELPDTIREKMNPYRSMLEHDDREDEYDRERTLDDRRW